MLISKLAWKKAAAKEGSSEETVSELQQCIDALNTAIGTMHLLPDRLMKLLRFASWDAGKKRLSVLIVDTTSALSACNGNAVHAKHVSQRYLRGIRLRLRLNA